MNFIHKPLARRRKNWKFLCPANPGLEVAKILLRLWKIFRGWARGEGVWG
jgi:hypothetical protein